MSDEAPANQLHAAANRIRDTAKWILATSGAVGVVLLAEVKLTNVAELELLPKVITLAIVIVGLAALAVAIHAVSNLLLPKGFTLTQVLSGGSPVGAEFVAANPEVLRGFPSVAALRDDRDADLASWHAAFEAWRADPTPINAAITKRASARANVSTAIANATADWVGYVDLRDEYQRAIRERIVPGILLAAVMAVLFAFLLPAEKQEDAAGAEAGTVSLAGLTLRGARLSGVDLTEANFAGAVLENADLSGSDLTKANLSGADLTGANLKGATLDEAQLESVSWSKTTCPDGVISDAVNNTCIGHLGPP